MHSTRCCTGPPASLSSRMRFMVALGTALQPFTPRALQGPFAPGNLQLYHQCFESITSMAANMAKVPLLDLHLPPSWLGDMIVSSIRSTSRYVSRELSATSHVFRDIVTKQCGLRSVLKLRHGAPRWMLQRDTIAMHVRALAMAEAANLDTHVCIEAHDRALPEDVLTMLITSSALIHGLQSQRPSNLLYKLQCVTACSLVGQLPSYMQLDSLIPDVLVNCPNLQEFTINNAKLTLQMGMAHRSCANLRQLTLRQVEFVHHEAAPAVPWLDIHLPALPSLTALNFDGVGRIGDYQEHGFLRAAIDKYSTQLKALRITGGHGNAGPSLPTEEFPWSQGTQFPALQQLCLDITALVNDASLQRLVEAAPHVTKMELGQCYGLPASCALAACGWKELTLSDVCVGDLAKLPLAACTRLVCGRSLRLSPGEIDADIAAASRAGGLQFRDKVKLRCDVGDVASAQAAIPLLGRLEETVVDPDFRQPDTYRDVGWEPCVPLVTALGQHLRCKALVIPPGFLKAPGALAELIELMPHVPVFGTWTHGIQAVNELVATIQQATRPFTLGVPFHSMPEHEQHMLRQAAAEAPHHLVTVEEVFSSFRGSRDW